MKIAVIFNINIIVRFNLSGMLFLDRFLLSFILVKAFLYLSTNLFIVLSKGGICNIFETDMFLYGRLRSRKGEQEPSADYCLLLLLLMWMWLSRNKQFNQRDDS